MISIIIPTYNRAHLLPRAIDSVLRQTYTQWELIISDDGSTDNTEEVLQPYLKMEKIRYLKNKNRGATSARNSGAKIAKGNYLTFLDSDDEAFEEWLASFAEKILEDCDIICCGYNYYDNTGEYLKSNYPENMGVLYKNNVGRFTNGGVFILKKALFEKVGGYDENVQSGQHSELAIRLFRAFEGINIKICNIQKPLIKVHIHKGEKIRGNDEAILNGTLYVLEKHKEVFKQSPILFSNYLAVAGVSAMRINHIRKGKSLFYRAWLKNPSNFKLLSRLIISYLPGVRKKIWLNE